MFKKIKKYIILAVVPLFLFVGLTASAITLMPVQQGGTGSESFTSGQVLIGNGIAPVTSISTSNWDSAFTHISSDGSDHTYINQDVTNGSSPTFLTPSINSLVWDGETFTSLTGTGLSNVGGVLTATGGSGAVDSVFGRTGVVISANGDYTTAQVTEDTNLYYTEARVNANTNVVANTAFRTTPSSVITSGDNISWTGNTLNVADNWYNSLDDLKSSVSNDFHTLGGTDANTTYTSSDFNHDSLSGVSANEHIDWTGSNTGIINATNYVDNNTTYTGGNALSLSGTTFNFDGGATPAGSLGGTWANPTVDSDSDWTKHNSFPSACSAGEFVTAVGDTLTCAVPSGEGTTYTAGTGLDLTSSVFSTNDSEIVHDNLSGFVANEHIDWTTDQGSTNINAGNYTDTNTTYLGGTNLTLSGNTFNVDDAWYNSLSDLQGSVSNDFHNLGGTDANTTYTAGDGLTLTATDFNCDTANTTTFGCLTSTDWNTFNNKTSFPGFTSLSADYSFTDNSTNWNTAYGWGDWGGNIDISTDTNLTVTSPIVLTGDTLSLNQSAITTLGTISNGAWNGTTISELFGGTGLSSYTSGDLLYSSANNELSTLGIGNSGEVLISDGSKPSWIATSSLGIIGGGSGLTDPMTTRGDLIYRNSSNVTSRLPIGTNEYVLTSDGTDISWAEAGGGGSLPWTVVGSDSLFNVGLLPNAVDSITNGSSNFGVGSSALTKIQYGHHNAGIGYNVLSENEGGSYNLAVGYESQKLGKSSNNLSIGKSALYNNLYGQNNIALGTDALKAASGASISWNIGIGQETGYGLSAGSKNIMIGYKAGRAVTTGASNILIGTEVETPSATDSSKLNIGNTIYGDLSTDYVGIGKVPTAELDVSGDIQASGTSSASVLDINNGTHGMKVIPGNSTTTLTFY